MTKAPPRPWPDYRAVWRWHFYAGLLCIPFVLWLACTGPIYLFKPQVEAWLDRPYAHLLAAGAPRPAPSAEARAALSAAPGSVLHAYQLPASPTAAAQVLVGKGADEWRVWIDPQTLRRLKTVREDDRLMQVVFRLHGELLLGDRGSMIVETAASWAIVMILTGLFLWWPRGVSGLGGLVYPRTRMGKAVFWRDLHASAGLWVSALTLMLLLSGLPWAKSWGGYLKEIRHLAGQSTAHQDWPTGSGSVRAQRAAQSADSMAGMAMGSMPMSMPRASYGDLDHVVPTVAALALPYPVLVAPPSSPASAWAARSDTQDRPRRVTLTLDGSSGAVLTRQDFGQRPWVDQAVGYGVAAHEGQLFGWPNTLLSLFTATGLITSCVTAIVMWLRRRTGGLGAPSPAGAPQLSLGLLAIVAALGVLLPLFGASVVGVALVERLVLRRVPRLNRWLGLRSIEHVEC